MTPETIYSLIAVGGTLLGYAVRHFQAQQAAASPSTTPPATPSGSSATQTPGRLNIGHGELLSLLLSAFNSPPPASSAPSLSTPAVSQPTAQPTAQVDVNALVQQLLAALVPAPPTTPATPTVVITPAKA